MMATLKNRQEATAWQKRYDAQAPQVGDDGSVVYRGGLGPFGFKPAELAEVIAGYLG